MDTNSDFKKIRFILDEQRVSLVNQFKYIQYTNFGLYEFSGRNDILNNSID